MEEENEIQTPETVQFQTPLRVRKARIAGAPRIGRVIVRVRYRDRFEVELPDYRAGSVISVPRTSLGQNHRQAIQAYLADGGAQ